jgi:hypothetical protein
MVASLDSLTFYQWGKEVTPGTSVVATHKIAVPRINFNPVGDPYRPQFAKGLVLRNRGNEFDIGGHVQFQVPSFPITYEQAANWFAMGICTPVITGTDPYTYVNTRDPAARPAITTFTIERRINDGSAQYDLEFSYCVITKIRIVAAMNAPLMAELEGFCRPPAVSAVTAAQSLPDPLEALPFATTKAFIDSAWDDLGTTRLAGTVVGWTWEFNTGWYPFYPADARSDKSFTRHEINGNQVTISSQIRILAEASGQWQTERTAASAQTLRAVRLQATGSDSRDLKIDYLGKHSARDIYTPEQADDRNEITLDFVESTDDTNFLETTLVNGVATLG